MKITISLWLLICAFVLCACGTSIPESKVEISLEHQDKQPTVVISATAAIQFTRQPTVTEPIAEPEPASELRSNLELPEAIQPRQVCSPLEGIGLDELPEIVSSPYAPPPPGGEERHHGVDFSFYQRGERASIEGVTIQTILSGKVAAAIQDRFPYGNMVIIETQSTDLSEELKMDLQVGENESLYLLYAHMAGQPGVEVGEAVPVCFPLGSVGKSGNAGVSHLHLETRLGTAGAQFPGMAYYTTQSTQEERDQYELWRTSGSFRHFDPLLLLTIIVK